MLDLPDNRERALSTRNRILLFIIWLRMYSTYFLLSNMFGISVSVIGTEINSMLPIVCNQLNTFIVWPSVREWHTLKGIWDKLPMAVGAIDGTSHRIYRPEVESQYLYYSGHRRYHCIHTQVITDANGIIRYVESGYCGHLNDAQQYGLMHRIGIDISFPEDVCLLGDKIYPNRGPIMTQYTADQLTRKDPLMRRKCRKLNSLIKQYRVTVEHAIGELKVYKAVGSLWRHPRHMLPSAVKTCAALVCRRKALGIIL
ncbi:hypothetical protein ACF0H5_007125 [Mactra antiquata]